MSYSDFLRAHKDLVGMIHLAALPGTPANDRSPSEIIEQALNEARLYRDAGLRTVMIENMHDVPYAENVGTEVTGLMAVIGREIKEMGLNCGIQILSANNQEALGVAHAAGLDFIRAEGFVFAHIGDEGFLNSCAADLLRYRRAIGAEGVLLFADIKKKHASHAITADIDLVETAKTAAFMRADGLIITAGFTGQAPNPEDLRALDGLSLIRVVGSGVTPANLADYIDRADVFIVGSWFKREGQWANAPDPERIRELVEVFESRR